MDLNTARARIHAMFTAPDETAAQELDSRIDTLLAAQNTEMQAQRVALAARLRSGQRWRQGRSQPLISQDYVSQDELRAIFGIPLTPPWEEPADSSSVVAYRDPNNPRTLLCRQHGPQYAEMVPVTSEDLPDGGICTFGRLSSLACETDVLIDRPGAA